MQLARYVGHGQVAIVDEPVPACPEGGLLVKTEACGLCSGELMAWYMDQKIPHVLGHEVAGIVVESKDDRFSVGERVFPHHHAPCLHCEFCRKGLYVHCAQWKRTKLVPGGMAEYFAVGPANLNDTLAVGDMRPVDAALIEPLACVMKSLRMSGMGENSQLSAATIGLGVMGLMHALMLGPFPESPAQGIGRAGGGSIAYDLNPSRVEWAKSLGLDARHPDAAEKADVIFVCPGSQAAFDFALRIAHPGARIVMFAPLAPGQSLQVPQEAYFRDITIAHSYSCGPDDTREAQRAIEAGKLRAEQVVSEFIDMQDLPGAYVRMRDGEILKPMVVF